MKHIAITGMPRSGSTLLYCMLKHVYEVYGGKFFDKEVRAFNNMAIHDSFTFTKDPSDIFRFRQIEGLARDMGVDLIWIITIRDVRDIITSMSPFDPGNYAIGAYRHGRGGVGIKYNFEAIMDFIQNAKFPYIIIKYEDLVTQTDHVQSSIMEHIKFNSHRKFTDFHKDKVEGENARTIGSVIEVHGKNIGRWATESQHIERVKEEFIKCQILRSYNSFFGYNDIAFLVDNQRL